jgi:hypothetical protein
MLLLRPVEADGDAVQVFAVSPVSDSSEAERRQDGSRILSAEIP